MAAKIESTEGLSYAFAEPIHASRCYISPNSQTFAIINGIRLSIYEIKTNQLMTTFNCIDKIDYCSYANDSDKILCFLRERNMIQAFSISDKEWKCKINDGKLYP